MKLLPITDWLPDYPRVNLRGDVIAGIALAGLLVLLIVPALAGVESRRAVGVALVYLVCLELFVVRTHALSWMDMGWPARAPGMLRTALQDVGVACLVMIPVTLGVRLISIADDDIQHGGQAAYVRGLFDRR